jgi:hypothetical protein
MSDFKETPANKLYKRVNESRIKLWLLMGGDRWLVAGLLVAVIFITLLTVAYFYPDSESAIRGSDSVDTIFQALLSSIITGVTLVVSLNQLVLSQELGAVYDQRERMEGAIKFRDDAADAIKAEVSPTRPSQFIRALVQVSANRAEKLKTAVSDSDNIDFKEEVTDFCSSLITNADQVAEKLNNAKFGEFEVISSALDFNYSWKIFAAKKIKRKYNDLLTEKGNKEIEKLIEVLYFFGPTREHFKTVYFQKELIDLSRRILFAAIPALLVASSMIIFFNPKLYYATIFNIGTLELVIAAAITISLLPFLILISYIVRIATITKHTLANGPFILRETDKVEEVEWGE